MSQSRISILALLFSTISSLGFAAPSTISASFVGFPNAINEGQSISGSWKLEVAPSDPTRKIVAINPFTAFFSGGDPPSQLVDPPSIGISGSVSIQADFEESIVILDESNVNVTMTIPYSYRLTSGAVFGDSAFSSTSVTVNNVSPTITKIQDDLTIGVNEFFGFSALATDPGVLDVLTYAWDFNEDGAFEFFEQSGQYSFDTVGDFTIGLRVTDGDGGVATDSFVVNVVSQSIVGDMNGDMALTEADVSLFVMALVDRSAYEDAYPSLNPDEIGDVNQDGHFNLGDVGAFKALQILPEPGSAQSTPEPSALLLGLCAIVFVMAGHRPERSKDMPARSPWTCDLAYE